jgi:hypothetical protein
MFGHRTIPIEVMQAKAIAAEISREADNLNEHLAEYKKARDPFAAMLADLHNRDQVSRIWRGSARD